MIFLWNCESLHIGHHCSVKLFNWIYISPYIFLFLFSLLQGQSFIPMMTLLRELLANLKWMIQRKFGLHPTTATLSNLNHNPSNIEEWSICWTCSSITIRLTFFVSFGQYEHGFCVTECVGLPTKALSGTDIWYLVLRSVGYTTARIAVPKNPESRIPPSYKGWGLFCYHTHAVLPKVFCVYLHMISFLQVVIHSIRLPKNSTIADVINDLKTKVSRALIPLNPFVSVVLFFRVTLSRTKLTLLCWPWIFPYILVTSIFFPWCLRPVCSLSRFGVCPYGHT